MKHSIHLAQLFSLQYHWKILDFYYQSNLLYYMSLMDLHCLQCFTHLLHLCVFCLLKSSTILHKASLLCNPFLMLNFGVCLPTNVALQPFLLILALGLLHQSLFIKKPHLLPSRQLLELWGRSGFITIASVKLVIVQSLIMY